MIPDLISRIIDFQAAKASQAAALARAIETDLPGLNSAFDAWLPGAKAPEAILALQASSSILRKLGKNQELVSLAEALAIHPSPPAQDPAFKAGCAAAQGAALMLLGRPRECLRQLLEALASYSRLGLEREADLVLGDLAGYAGRYGKAMEVALPFMERLEQCKRKGNKASQAETLWQMSRLEEMQGHTQEMQERVAEAIALYKELDNPKGVQDCLILVADCALKNGEYAEAEKWGREILASAGRVSGVDGLAWAEHRMAELEMLTGGFESSISRLEKCLALTNPAQERWAWCYFHNKLGEAYRIAGRLDQAAQASRESLDGFKAMDDLWGTVWAGEYLGYALFLAGKKEEGLPLVEAAAATYRKQNNLPSLGGCMARLAEMAMNDARQDAAWDYLREGLRASLEQGHVSLISEALAVAAACLYGDDRSLGGELAYFVKSRPESSFAAKATLGRLGVKPASKLVFLAGSAARKIDFPAAARLVMTVSAEARFLP